MTQDWRCLRPARWASRLGRLALRASAVLVVLSAGSPALAADGMAGAAASDTDAAQKRIVWLVADWPPYYIFKNGKAPSAPGELGDGAGDRMLAELIARLPAYAHSFQISNIQRTWATLEAGQNVCYTGAARNAYHDRIALLTPFAQFPTPVLVIRHDRRERLGLPPGPVSLTELVSKRPDLSGLVQQRRSYGAEIDAILGRAGNVQWIPVNGMADLLHQLDAGRADYVIEYPTLVEFGRRTGAYRHELDLLSLSDAPPLLTAYIACTRNAWGQGVSADIEKAVRKAAGSRNYRYAIRDWMSSGLQKQVGEEMDRFFDQLAAGSPVAQ